MSIQDFARNYQKSPIILTNGIANSIVGGLLPIVSLSQALPVASLTEAVNSEGVNLNDTIFNFSVMPGGTLAENQVATYPFANQAIAANAIIPQPLRVSLMMVAPANIDGAYQQKIYVFQALKKAIEQHNAIGGTYTVATPSYLYTNCLLLSLRDVSDGDPSRPQDRWQWDFLQPLLTIQAAQKAESSLNQKVSSQTKVVPNANGEIVYYGQDPAIGNPASLIAPSVISGAQNLIGAGVAAIQPNRIAPT